MNFRNAHLIQKVTKQPNLKLLLWPSTIDDIIKQLQEDRQKLVQIKI